ncbi:MAG: GAF domain-containing protein, partial [Chloroflexi bacterium]|nr:GAF domain-containing protein [Chloroflexota bacterium]
MEQELTSAIAWTFLDNLNEGVILIESNGVVQYANSAAHSLLGLDHKAISLAEIYQTVAPHDETWQTLLAPPAKTRLRANDGRILTIEAKPIPNYDHNLIQLLITPAPPATQPDTSDHLTSLTYITEEPDFDKKLQLIVNGLQMTGWNRALLTLRDKDFQPTKLIMAGFTDSEKRYLRQNMLPAAKWRQLFASEELKHFRRGDCYFVPGESAWAKENLGMALPDHTAVGGDVNVWHPRDLLFVPLYDRQRQKIGMLGLDQPRNERRPDPRALQTIELYAHFAASVIENAQLVNEALTRSREFQTLFEANRAISGALDKNTVVTLMGKHMRRAINADGYTIYQWRADTDQLIVLQDYAHPQKFEGAQLDTLAINIALPLEQTSPLHQVITAQEPQVLIFPVDDSVKSSADDLALQPFPNWLDKNEPFTSVILPIILSEETFGLIALIIRSQDRSFDERKLQLLTVLSNQATTVLETALIFEDTYEREQFYNALGRVSLAINYTLDRTDLMDLICQESLRIFNVDGAYLWQRENDQFIGGTAKGAGEAAFADSIVPLSDAEAFAVHVFREKRTVYLNQVNVDNQIHLRLPQKETIQAALGIPLEQENEIIGVMVLVDRQNPTRFGDKDISQA